MAVVNVMIVMTKVRGKVIKVKFIMVEDLIWSVDIVHFRGDWKKFDDGEDGGDNNDDGDDDEDDDGEIGDGFGADDVADCQKSLPAERELASLLEVIWTLRN